MLKLFREAGMPRRVPPPLPACANEDTGATPPLNITYALRRLHPDGVIALEASAAADAQSLFWFDGDGLIGNVAVGAGALPWRPTVDGPHLTRAIDDHGREAERDVRVDFAP